jgi:hypothetical protein
MAAVPRPLDVRDAVRHLLQEEPPDGLREKIEAA